MTIKAERKIRKEIFIVLFIIYITDSVFFGVNNNIFFTYFSRITVFILGFGSYFKYLFKKKFIVDKSDFLLLVITAFILASMLLNGGSIFFYITLISLMLFASIYAKRMTYERFGMIFINIIVVIAAFSLVCELFRSRIISASFIPTFLNASGIRFKFLILTNIDTTVSKGFTRNFGPFWEPGAYQFYLNVAVYFLLFSDEHFFSGRRKAIYLLIFLITLVSTGSGVALIPFILIIISFCAKKKTYRQMVLAILLLCMISILYYFGLLDAVLNRALDTTGNSFQIRFYNIVGNMYAFLQSPIIGSHADKCIEYRTFIYSMFSRITYPNNVNTFPAYFAYLGGPVGLYFVVKFYLHFKSITNQILCSVLLLLAMLISTSNENFTTSILLVVLVFLRNEPINNELVNQDK